MGLILFFTLQLLKQVPTCEFYPMEAVKTNILGAENVMLSAIACQVKKVIVLSTDKAVYPINAMGISKAMMERLMVAKSRVNLGTDTIICGTRYGNVMASRGSVIPLFVDALLEGRKLTVTDPSMTRFLMSLDDSVNLVFHAFNHGQSGDIFVQKAPAATVGAIVEALEKIFNTTADVEIIGTRHGEKLFESLLSREEMARAEDIGEFYRVPADDQDLDYSKYFTEGEDIVTDPSGYTSHNTHRLAPDQLVELLASLPYIKGRLNA